MQHVLTVHSRALPILKALSIPLIAITNAQPKHLGWFHKQHKLEGMELYTDPDMETYKAAGLHYGFTLKGGISEHIGKYSKAGVLNRNALRGGTGDFRQMGGTLVMGQDNEVLWRWIDSNPQDPAPINTILTAAGAPDHMIQAVPTGQFDAAKPNGGDPAWVVPSVEAPAGSVESKSKVDAVEPSTSSPTPVEVGDVGRDQEAPDAKL